MSHKAYESCCVQVHPADKAAVQAYAEGLRMKRNQRVCLFCGSGFTPSRIDAKYCSGMCRSNANNKKRRGITQ